MNRCPAFWMDDPSVIWKDAHDFFPFHAGAKRCTTTALNSFTRFGLYLGIVLAIIKHSPIYLALSVGIAITAIAAYYGMKDRGAIREGFEPEPIPPAVDVPEYAGIVKGIEAAGKPVADVIGQTKRTSQTAANPFMNVLVNEIGDNPTRGPAKTGDMTREMSEFFQTNMYGDQGDVFQHGQNQRIWTVQPNTSIPNDRDSFQNWLYRVPGRTCKEGNTRICKTGTEGSQYTWLNMA